MPRRARAPSLTIEQRIQAIVQIKLDGAEGHDILQFVAENEAADKAPWQMGKRGKHLCERQIRYYMAEADKRIRETSLKVDPGALFRHRAQRNRLYARAVQAGDYRTALAVLNNLAKLEGLYPHQGFIAERCGHDPIAEMTDAELDAEIDRLDKLHQGRKERCPTTSTGKPRS